MRRHVKWFYSLLDNVQDFPHLSYFYRPQPACSLKVMDPFFISCGDLWKSPVTASDSPMNNRGPLSVPTYPGTSQGRNKCEGQPASIKVKNAKDFGAATEVKLLHWELSDPLMVHP